MKHGWKALSGVLLCSLVIGAISVKIYIDNYLAEYLQGQYQQSIEVWRETNKTLPKNGIVFLGDSITQGFNVHEFYYELPVINRGIIGDTTTGVLARMTESVYELAPSKIFLLIGSNDLGEENKTSQYIAANIEKIIMGIKENSPSTTIYVQSIYPVYTSKHPKVKKSEVSTRTNEKIQETNAAIQATCESIGATYIDVYSCLLDSRGELDIQYTTEGLHLNVVGYQKVMELLSPYILEEAESDNHVR